MRSGPVFLALALALCLAGGLSGAPAWRSSLYPESWHSGLTDNAGHFLHDFSYAGYHSGEQPIPDLEGPITDVTAAPYNADATGATDTTLALQKAIDAVGLSGGGVVYLPAGTYRIAPQGTDTFALKIRDARVVLRGAGTSRTFLFNDSIAMRGKRVLSVESRNPAYWNAGGKESPGIALTADLPRPTTLVPLADVSGFSVGEIIVVRNDMTQSFIDRLVMTGKWKAGAPANRPLAYCRRILFVDTANRTLTVDVPLRGFLYTADRARVVKVSGHLLSEVGLEDLSIGMRQHPGSALADDDYNKPGTAAYDVHGSVALEFSNAENCWVRRVNTYAPSGNSTRIHILSNGLKLWSSRLITVADCDFKFPQYRGGGGNGYLFCLNAQDNLLRDCRGEGGRHNFDFGTMLASGNVLLNCTATDGDLASDFHMYFSLANLLDNTTCDGDYLEARAERPWGEPIHGVTTTQSVFWNTQGLRYAAKHLGAAPALIHSKQFGEGYIIGTRGPASAVDSDDFVEGVGRGETLEPRSLYTDQLSRRLALKKQSVLP